MKDTHDTAAFLAALKHIKLAESSRTRIWNTLETYADFHSAATPVRISESESQGFRTSEPGMLASIGRRLRAFFSGSSDKSKTGLVRIHEAERLVEHGRGASIMQLFNSLIRNTMKATLLIALVLAGGGTSLAAQSAVPGDVLYPVKVHVNENVRSWLAVGTEAEAELQADLLAERLEEAEQLAAEGKLEGEIAADVRANIAAQVTTTADLSATLAAEGKTDAATNVYAKLRSSLNTFSNALASFAANLDTTVATNFAADVENHEQTIATKEQASLATELAGEVRAQTLIDNAEVHLEGLRSTISGAAELATEVRAQFEVDMEAAANRIADAKASLTSGAEAEAKANATAASELIGKVEAALSLLGNVEIDPDNGSIIDINFDGNATSNIEADGEASLEGDMIDSVEGSLSL